MNKKDDGKDANTKIHIFFTQIYYLRTKFVENDGTMEHISYFYEPSGLRLYCAYAYEVFSTSHPCYFWQSPSFATGQLLKRHRRRKRVGKLRLDCNFQNKNLRITLKCWFSEKAKVILVMGCVDVERRK